MLEGEGLGNISGGKMNQRGDRGGGAGGYRGMDGERGRRLQCMPGRAKETRSNPVSLVKRL